ncbi:hypothetical protein V8C42DRAFT_110940 [Trichoderma barbatum]
MTNSPPTIRDTFIGPFQSSLILSHTLTHRHMHICILPIQPSRIVAICIQPNKTFLVRPFPVQIMLLAFSGQLYRQNDTPLLHRLSAPRFRLVSPQTGQSLFFRMGIAWGDDSCVPSRQIIRQDQHFLMHGIPDHWRNRYSFFPLLAFITM